MFLESIRHYQAAVAIRPRMAALGNKLGLAPMESGRSDEDALCFDYALEILGLPGEVEAR